VQPRSVPLRFVNVRATQLIVNVQIFAGIISLLNDYRISNGRPPLGFLNPWLYGSGFEGFNDVTDGSNPGCGTGGFAAIVGWDPVSPTRVYLWLSFDFILL
jgi:hypothetical protein